MIRFTKYFLGAVLLCGVSAPAMADFRSIDDVLRNASRRDKVVLSGTIKRAFDFDTLLLNDGTADIAVSFLGLRQSIRVGEKIVVAGRFDGRVSYRSTYGLINALEWSLASDPKAAALEEKYAVAISSPAPASPVASPPVATTQASSNVELRLLELENLKSKNLITPAEYQQQRKRILDQL